MGMGWAWTVMVCVSLLFALLTGRWAEVGAAVTEGAAAAVQLLLAMAGPVILWSAVMEALRAAGVLEALARRLRPLLRRLFPSSRGDEALSEALCCNLSANLLGLGNAATPAGVRAAQRLREHAGSDTASDELCRLVVLNTASVQLLPLTVAAIRAGLGSAAPLDILPAVWITSLVSVTAGLAAERLLRRFTCRP